MARLEEICSLITDGSHFSPEDEGVGYPMFSVKDMTPNGFNISGCKKIGEEAYKKLVANGCKPLNDDVVVAKDGSYLKTAFVIKGNPEIALLSSIAILRPKIDLVVPEYLSYFLKSDAVYRTVSLNYITGTALKRIILKGIRKIEVDLPDIGEQEQRAQRLSKVDYLCQLRKQQLDKLDELVKARFVEMFGDDIYPKVKVSRVCDFITKGTTPPNNLISEKYSSDKVPYLKVYNLSFTGKLLFDTAPQYVPENIHNGVLARSKVYPNDVLMNIVGPPLGKFALVTDEFSEWNINQAIAIFRAKEKVNPKYLLFALMQPEVLKPFLRQAVGIRQLNLSLAQCRDLEIPLPPLSLQSEFAAFVEHVDEQKQTVQQSLEKLELMKKALMQEYFG